VAFLETLNWLYPLAGLFVGVLVGMTGVGGGSLMTPLLVLLFNFHPATAVGTDLLFASLTKTVGSAVHGWRSTVDWRIVWRLALGSVPAAALTLLVLDYIGPPTKEATHLITYVLGAMLIFTSVAVLFQGRLVYWASTHFGARFNEDRAWPTTLLGVLLGAVVSISSVGAGAIGVTALLILYPHMPVAKIVGSDIAHAVPLTMVAGVGHLWIGNVDLNLLASLLIGSVPGVIIGSYIGSGASDRFLRPMLAAVLILVGLKLLTS
jgi:uncharacterized protein